MRVYQFRHSRLWSENCSDTTSRFHAHVLDQAGDVLAAIQPRVARVAPGVEPEPFAGRDEEFEDLRRVVREVVAQVLVPARPVDVDAAVGANAAPKERPWRGVDELPLPALEHDRPIVLLAGAVLREQTGEVPVVDAEHDGRAAVGRDAPDLVARKAPVK